MSRLPRQYRCLSISPSSSYWSTTCSPPRSGGRTRVHEPPDLFRAFLHCYYEDVYGTRPVTRELQHGLVWYYCGLDKPPSRDTVDRFLTDLEHVIDDVFDRLVEFVRPLFKRKTKDERVAIDLSTRAPSLEISLWSEFSC